MELVIKGRHMEVRPDVRDYAEGKIAKVTKVLNGMIMSIDVELYPERNPSIEKNQVAEVTIHMKHPGPVIRAREAATDMKAAVDLVSEKLHRQISRVKGKLDRKHAGAEIAEAEYRAAAQFQQEEESSEEESVEPATAAGGIVKRKTYELKPMVPEEAILQLELLGHDFFVFTSAETDAINVLYRRRDGDYGLIVPKGA